MNGERFWADWLSRDRRWIETGDFYGVEHFLSAFGGMGSLNDVYFSHEAERVLQPLGEASQIARRLQREQDFQDP